MKVYYAHPINYYNTTVEKNDIETLEKLGFEVFNTNQKWIEQGYINSGRDMNFFKTLIEDCHCLAVRPNHKNDITSGVAFEINYAYEIGIPVFVLTDHTTLKKKFLSYEATKKYIKKYMKFIK